MSKVKGEFKLSDETGKEYSIGMSADGDPAELMAAIDEIAAEHTPDYRILPGTKNLSGEFVSIQGSRTFYEDKHTGERVYMAWYEAPTMVINVIARTRSIMRKMTLRLDDDFDNEDTATFEVKPGWKIISVSHTPGPDDEYSKPVVIMVQSGI